MKNDDSETEKFFSQYLQDQYLDTKVFKGKRGGVFVDIGANDGVSLSNSYFFERFRCWRGLCIEPIPAIFQQLQKNRSCICVHGCIGPTPGEREFLWVKGPCEMFSGFPESFSDRHRRRISESLAEVGGSTETIIVPTYRLGDLLDKHGMSQIDYCSIDTEGGELGILQSIDFKRYQIDYLTVENNYPRGLIQRYMAGIGYHRFFRKGADGFYRRTGRTGWLRNLLGF